VRTTGILQPERRRKRMSSNSFDSDGVRAGVLPRPERRGKLEAKLAGFHRV
jgi:hypothetical protein